MSGRFAFFLWGLIFLGAGIFGFFFFKSFKTLKSPPHPSKVYEKRQPLPEPSVLQLPPQIPVPSSSFAIPHLTSKPALKSRNQTSEKSLRPLRTFTRLWAPSPWAILKKYQQVFELDDKYYEIALDSDRYGYVNQAILYYRKYLFVAPSGSHAQEVRSRLTQLGGE